MESSEKILNRAYVLLMKITRRLSGQQLMIVPAIVVGLVSGFAAYAFGMAPASHPPLPRELDTRRYGRLSLSRLSGCGHHPRFAVREAYRGDNISEGVTRVLYAISKTGSRIRGHNCYTSMVGGAVTIGFGGSVGPEAPHRTDGGRPSAPISRRSSGSITVIRRCCWDASAAGAHGGHLQGSVTGLIFVLEVLMLDISMRAIVPLLISSVVSTTLVLFLKGVSTPC